MTTLDDGLRREILASLSERDFMGHVIRLLKALAHRVYHTFDSRRSEYGFPDIVAVKPPIIWFIEVKTERGKLAEAQREWLDLLRQCNRIEVRELRPHDWDDLLRDLDAKQ